MNRFKLNFFTTFTILVGRYEVYCTFLTAQCSVASPRHGITMPRCRALPCTAMKMHYASSNFGF